MANKRFVLYIGDSNAAGANEGTDLTPAGWGSLAGAQTNYNIWNIQTSQWETYNAGSNSYTSIPGSNLCGPEVAIYNQATGDEAFAPGEDLYLFKMSAYQIGLLQWNNSLTETGAANPGGVNYNTFWPQARNAFYTAARTELAAAIADLEGTGDTLVFEGISIIMGTLDALPPWGKLAYERLLLEFIQQMREEVDEISGTNTTKPRVVIVNTHDDYQYTDADERARFQVIRIAGDIARQHLNLDKNFNGARVINTQDLITLRNTVSPVDYVHFDVNSMVNVGQQIAQQMWASDAALDDFPGEQANTLDVYIMIGDGHCVGYGNTVTGLPAHLSTVTETYMWMGETYFEWSGGWTEMVPGTSNNPTLDHLTGHSRFGPEVGFAEEARQTRRNKIYIIKLGLDGSFGSSSLSPLTTNPFAADLPNDWNPASQELFAKLQDWINLAIDSIIVDEGGAGITRVRGMTIQLGTEDLQQQDDGLQANELEGSITHLIARVRDHLANYVASTYEPVFNEGNEDGSKMPVLLVQPDSSYTSLAISQNYTNKVRSALRNVAENDDYVGLFDPTGLYSFDSTNTKFYDSNGNLDLGKAMFTALTGSLVETVNPLFTKNKQQLIDRLRLKGVPTTSNANDLIDEAIQLVKTNFYRRMGRARLKTLQAIALNPAPESADDWLRLMAASTEIKWVKMELMRTMPLMFMDGNVPNQVWQEEAAFREATIAQISSEMRRMRGEIEESLQVLSGELSPTEFNRIRATAVDPDNEPPDPGDTVRVRGGVY